MIGIEPLTCSGNDQRGRRSVRRGRCCCGRWRRDRRSNRGNRRLRRRDGGRFSSRKRGRRGISPTDGRYWCWVDRSTVLRGCRLYEWNRERCARTVRCGRHGGRRCRGPRRARQRRGRRRQTTATWRCSLGDKLLRHHLSGLPERGRLAFVHRHVHGTGIADTELDPTAGVQLKLLACGIRPPRIRFAVHRRADPRLPSCLDDHR